MPRRIIVQVSDDGQAFRTLGEVTSMVRRNTAPVAHDFTLAATARTRYVRVHVERYGRLPAWHPGAGNEGWFFADEIVVK